MVNPRAKLVNGRAHACFGGGWFSSRIPLRPFRFDVPLWPNRVRLIRPGSFVFLRGHRVFVYNMHHKE